MTREEAIEVYNGLINTKIKEAFEFFAPELREINEEEIRKDIIGGLMWQRDNLKSEGPHDNNLILPGFCLTVGKHLSYLEKQKEPDKMIVVSPEVWDNAISDAFENGKKEGEKQKEQKPAEWSEEDEKMMKSILWVLESYVSKDECGESPALTATYPTYFKEIAWLKSLRPQPKKESVEEKIMNFLDAIGDCGFTQADMLKLKSIWKECGLPSLQPHWKPSKEQMEALKRYSPVHHPDVHLVSLYDDLKKLM